MLFINNTGETKKVRKDDLVRVGMYVWKNVKPGETISIPEAYGINIGFDKVGRESVDEVLTEEPDKEPEENVDEVSQKDYEKRLKSIEGLGKKTFKDILEIYPTLNDLKKAISEGKTIPVRDDIEKGILVEFA